MSQQILYLHNHAGQLMAVQIPAQLWQRLEPFAAKFIQPPASMEKKPAKHDLANFNDFTRAWDFRYPYDPRVCCPNCQVNAADWREGDAFTLLNANIGGLLVFRCNTCQGTIRQKFFKDHVAVEFTPHESLACAKGGAK